MFSIREILLCASLGCGATGCGLVAVSFVCAVEDCNFVPAICVVAMFTGTCSETVGFLGECHLSASGVSVNLTL